MASHRLKQTMRGAMAATAVAAAVTLNSFPASAEPSPSGNQDLSTLNKAAEQADQAYLAAKDDLAAKQAELAKANDDIASATKAQDAAKQQEDQFRGQVDQLSAAAFKGATFTPLSALLTGKSAQDFLDQSSALKLLSSQNSAALDKLDAAVNQATDAKNKADDAKKRAQDATDAAAKILADLGSKKDAADTAVTKAKAALGLLSGSALSALGANGDMGTFIGPPGAAGVAMQEALAERGVPYVWGGTTPSGFDCSGLMQWAYAKAGVSLPRSAAAQYTVGKPVSMNDLQPGDLIFYGSSPSGIHHVSMYVGGGKVVHAPTEGEVVKVVPINQSGSDIYGAKRIVG